MAQSLPLDPVSSRLTTRRTLARALQVCRPPEPLTPSQWAERNYVCSTHPGGQPGQWRFAPYQRALIDLAFGHPDVRTVTILKSARIGYSTLLRAYLAYCIAHQRRQPLMYLPTETDALNTMRIHVEPTIRSVLPLRDLCDINRRGKHNLESRKHFANGLVLHVLGGKAARNYREHTKDLVIYDELDGFDRNIEGEGAPTALGDARVTNSPWRKSIRGSTPTVQGLSQIEESADLADESFHRHLPCPACDAMQPLTWGQLKWEEGGAPPVRHECRECGHGALYSDMPAMDERGRWVSDSGVWMDEQAQCYRDSDGGEIAAPAHVCINIWAAYSPFMPWQELVGEHYKALRASKRGDHTQRQSFVNLRLGQCWSQPGTEVDAHWLMTRREAYRAAVPAGVELLVAGCDVQADRLEVEVLGIGADSETWSIAYRVIYGKPQHEDPWRELDSLLDESFETEDGRVLQLSGLAVDEGYATDTVRGYCAARLSRRVVAVKGVGGDKIPLVDRGKKRAVGALGISALVFNLGVDNLKSLVYSMLLVPEPGPGFQHFPMSYSTGHFESLTAEKQVTRHRRGYPVREWNLVRARNEVLDCRVYALACSMLVRPQQTATARVAVSRPPAPSAGSSEPRPPPRTPPPRTPPRRPSRGRTRLRDRF